MVPVKGEHDAKPPTCWHHPSLEVTGAPAKMLCGFGRSLEYTRATPE